MAPHLQLLSVRVPGNHPGKPLITLAISSDFQLHTPIYFFLSYLSFDDICLSKTIVTKMLINIQTQDQRISYRGFLTQLCFAIVYSYLENFLLAVIAYDHYMIICQPLRYTVMASPFLCVILVLFSLFTSIVGALLHSLMVLQMSFFTKLEIHHFFYELLRLLSAPVMIPSLIYVESCVLSGVPFSRVIFSYVHIVSSVLRMALSQGKYKVFTTCDSYLSVVCFMEHFLGCILVLQLVTHPGR
jgi:olfactory receptor